MKHLIVRFVFVFAFSASVPLVAQAADTDGDGVPDTDVSYNTSFNTLGAEWSLVAPMARVNNATVAHTSPYALWNSCSIRGCSSSEARLTYNFPASTTVSFWFYSSAKIGGYTSIDGVGSSAIQGDNYNVWSKRSITVGQGTHTILWFVYSGVLAGLDDVSFTTAADNCPLISNVSQIDSDVDGFGDACDALPNNSTESVDTDGDGTGNNADTDDDNDGVVDADDAFPLDASEWADTDGDGIGNNAEDDDGDGLGNGIDNCPAVFNPIQSDKDNDGFGDECDSTPGGSHSAGNKDWDKDGVSDAIDNCPKKENADQSDIDNDGLGDACDKDKDGDGVRNGKDKYPLDSARW